MTRLVSDLQASVALRPGSGAARAEIISSRGREWIRVYGDTYALRDRLGGIISSRWDGVTRSWILPATPAAAADLAYVPGIRLSADVEELGGLHRWENSGLEEYRDFSGLNSIGDGGMRSCQFAALRSFLRATRGLIYHGMGTGKTRVAIELMADEPRCLILCPKAVVEGVWPEELYKWDRDLKAPNRLFLGRGSTAQKAKKVEQLFDRRDAGLVVVNYDSAWRGKLAATLLSMSWDVIICDEIQRIKSPSSKVSRFAARLARRARRRFGLSGTPCPHSPLDAYGVFRFLDPGIFGENYVKFRSRYAVLGGYEDRQVVAWQNQEDFNKRFYSVTHRADTADVLDLPEHHHVERVFTLPPKAQRIYRELEAEWVALVSAGGEVVSAENALAKVMLLHEVACGHVKDDDGNWIEIHDAREEALAELLDEIALSEAVVVFCRFRLDYDAVHRAAKKAGRKSFELSGRADQLAEWKADDTGSVLVSSGQSGAEGVDMTRACYCFYYSHGTSLGNYEQSLARVHRPGQSRRVTYVHFVADKTIDRRLIAAHRQKRKILDLILHDPRWVA